MSILPQNPQARNDLLDTALGYQGAGLSIIPIRTDGSKAPAIASWKHHQTIRADEARARDWFDRPHPPGIAIIHGRVSGGTEVIDFDEDAEHNYLAWTYLVELEAPGLIDRLTKIKTPRSEHSRHVIYRCMEIEIPGAIKLAMKIAPLPDDPHHKDTLIETRGEGGYTVAPGSPPGVHESGRLYLHESGPLLTALTTISAAERTILIRAAQSFDRMDQTKEMRPTTISNGDLRPGDDYCQRNHDIAPLLEAHGWQHVKGAYWRRPGKSVGWSATWGHCHNRKREPLFCVFSTSTAFPGPSAGRSCSVHNAFAVFALLEHGGDFRAAARILARQGYGAQPAPTSLATFASSSARSSTQLTNPADHDQEEPPRNPLDNDVNDALYKAPTPDADSLAPEPDAGDGGKQTNMATRIVALAQAAGVKMFRTPDHVPYARIRVGEHHEVYGVLSGAFRRWLAGLHWSAAKKAANANAITDAVSTLAAAALYEGREIEVHTRLARTPDAIYLDLADTDWRIIEITRDGWSIVSDPPVMFRRPAGMLSLPGPQQGGSIGLLRPFVNTKSDMTYRLVVAYLIACLCPGRPFPVLFLRGEHGSAKSTLARFLRRLLDPNTALLRRPPRDDRDTIIAAKNGWIVALDNLSYIPDWLSDALCCLATGSGFATRTLYTDSDETLFAATRPIILTAIEDVVTRGDLMDRCLTVDLEPIPDERRRPEVEIEAEFARAQPLILGALLDVVAVVLRNLPTTRPLALPRMADFALWISAAEPALGWTRGTFLADYAGNRAQSTEAILAASPLYDPLTRLLDTHADAWQGTATDLLSSLTALAGDSITRSRSWPANPAPLINRLLRLTPALRQVGITIQRDRAGHHRTRILTVSRARHDSSSASSASSAT